ncbi:ribonuclease H-like domain-containing protein [Tanacetum coccineum]
MSHSHPKGNFVPKAVLIKSGLKTLNTARQNSSRAALSINTARPINTAYLRPTKNYAKPASNVFNRAHSHNRRPFNKFTTNKNHNFNEKVNTVKGNVTTIGPKVVVSDSKGNEANVVKASACWVWRPKQKSFRPSEILKLDIMLRDNALTELRKKFEKAEKERDDLKLTLEKFESSSKNLIKLLEIELQLVKLRLVSQPKSVSEPLIEDWISDSENENETEFKSKQRKPSFAKVEFVKSNEHVKSPRESIKKVENNKQAKYSRKNSQSPRGNKRNWNNLMTQKLGSNFEFKNKACYVCGSFNHLIKDCDFYEKKMVEKRVWNNTRRVNHQNSQRMSHPYPKRNFVPKSVLMKSSLKTLNTAYPRPTVNCARQASNVFHRAHSHVTRLFNKFTTNKNSNFNEKVNIVKRNVTTVGPKAVVSNNKGIEANAIKASACWIWRPKQKVLDHGNPQQDLKNKGVIDSGCSRHMKGNRSYLSDYEEIYGGYVAFGGDPKGGKITSKGKISTCKLDFENMYFVKELKFNLFSVSQMCDKKNIVLFTDTECVVLSPDFKLLDES